MGEVRGRLSSLQLFSARMECQPFILKISFLTRSLTQDRTARKFFCSIKEACTMLAINFLPSLLLIAPSKRTTYRSNTNADSRPSQTSKEVFCLATEASNGTSVLFFPTTLHDDDGGSCYGAGSTLYAGSIIPRRRRPCLLHDHRHTDTRAKKKQDPLHQFRATIESTSTSWCS